MTSAAIAPTMEDVARAAEVHQTTVSRALRGDLRISENTRQRICKIAEKIGYSPNPLLSALGSLRRQRASVHYQTPLAYILRADMHHSALVPHLAGARQAATQRGFKLEEFVLDDAMHPDRLNTILFTRNIHGIIIGPLPEAHGGFALQWNKLCTVVIEYSFSSPAFDRVVTDSYRTMNQVLRECRNRGYSRCGVVLAKVVDERNEGLLSAAYSLARERDPFLADIPSLIMEKWDEKTFLRWKERQRPEVIISSNLLLPQIRNSLCASNREIPGDIGLVNLNADPSSDYSGICQDAPAIGAAAVRLLIEKLNNNERGIPSSRTTLMTEGYWFEGSTLPPAASASGHPRLRKQAT